jgi:hypothetical protein
LKGHSEYNVPDGLLAFVAVLVQRRRGRSVGCSRGKILLDMRCCGGLRKASSCKLMVCGSGDDAAAAFSIERVKARSERHHVAQAKQWLFCKLLSPLSVAQCMGGNDWCG